MQNFVLLVRFPRRSLSSDQNQRPIPPVLKRFLPRYQTLDLLQDLKSHDRVRLIKERNARGRTCECGQETELVKIDRDPLSRKILSRPSIIVRLLTSVSFSREILIVVNFPQFFSSSLNVLKRFLIRKPIVSRTS